MSSAAQPETRIISAAEFKAKCLQLMDEVNEKKLTLIITKRGKPVMQASAPQEEKPFRSIIGRSPNIKVPNEAQWAKFKAKWADEWDEGFQRSVRSLGKAGPKKAKKR